MKTTRILAVLLLCGLAAAVPAQAHHVRAHVGIFFGAPLWGWYPPAYYYPPYGYPSYYADYPYYYPRVVEVPVTPPTYVERAPSVKSGYWYYCEKPQGYYPYVKNCPGGWQRVAPEPSD